MIFQREAKLIKNIEVTQGYYKILISSARIAKVSKPGQFIQIKVSDDYQPLLRRPFSIHRIKGSNIEILYEVLGSGTQILAQKKSGEYLDIIGPLGNGFDYRSPGYQDTASPVLVAGGMGVAPLFFLAEKLAQRQTSSAKRRTRVLIGARTKHAILCEKEFKRLGFNVKIATDDGSAGFKGKVTDLLKSILRTTNHEPRTTIYACGPRPMLKEISRISQKYNLPAQISLEEHMACGIGACLGCVVNTKYGYKRVCQEGPVFDVGEIVW